MTPIIPEKVTAAFPVDALMDIQIVPHTPVRVVQTGDKAFGYQILFMLLLSKI